MATQKNKRVITVDAPDTGSVIKNGRANIACIVLHPDGTNAASFELYAADTVGEAVAAKLISSGRVPGVGPSLVIPIPVVNDSMSVDGLWVILTGTGAKLFVYLA